MMYQRHQSVQSQRIGDGSRITLPCRVLGKGRWAALFLVVFGLVFLGAAINWMKGPIASIPKETDTVSIVFSVVFALFGLPFLCVGLASTLGGLLIISNRTRSEIEVSRTHVRAIERFGPLWWSWKRPSEEIRRLVLQPGMKEMDTDPDDDDYESKMAAQKQLRMYDFWAIRAESDEAGPLFLAVGYSRHLVQQAGSSLALLLPNADFHASEEP